MIRHTIFIILLVIFFQKNSFSSDPFTNEIGLIKEPEVIEIEIEDNSDEATNTEEEALEEETLIAEDLFEDIKETVSVVQDGIDEEIEAENKEIVTVLNIDPMIAYSLKDYTLKGTALSKASLNDFKRAKIKKFDTAKIPTTHTIQPEETIEKIAFRYGFSLREIELANAIYPGSRKLITGDKLVIPNRFHIVKEGQSLLSISDRYNLDPLQLSSYNDLSDENVLMIGDKLLLPFFIHVTNENETIKDIAGRYEREINEIIEFNNFDSATLVVSENQLVKIPIYANRNINNENINQKSINDFKIDKKNLAIVEIGGGQYMVREGDRIGNKDGKIVSIQINKMLVLEDNIEFEFFINTPIVGQAVAQLGNSNEGILDDIMSTGSAIDDDASNPTSSSDDIEDDDLIDTDVDGLFN